MKELKKQAKPAVPPRGFFQNRERTARSFFGIQARLDVGQPDDKYEQEADAVADTVVNKNQGMDGLQPLSAEEEEVQPQPLEASISRIQKEEMADEELVQSQCQDCEKREDLTAAALEENEEQLKAVVGEEERELQATKTEEEPVQMASEEELLQAKSEAVSQGSAGSIEKPLQESKGLGNPLDPDTKNEMESGFGTDFSQVKIHTDTKAVQMAKEIGAQAFTHGTDIYFNRGKYNPQSKTGKHLLAHELTHTIQQNGGRQKPVQRRLNDGHDFPPTSRFSTNPVLESTFDNFATVNSGSSGTHVTLIQQALVALEYRLPRFGVDGSFGDETKRAVEAFQEDVGLSVDGVVGTNTIDLLDKRDRGAEVSPPVLPVLVNGPLNLTNVIVQPGAAPSIALGAGEWGLTFPENVQVQIEIIDNGGIWQPVLTGVIGNYSLQTRLLPGVTEVTGPGGNTAEANYCDQINDLNSLTLSASSWFMDAAILAHERVHAEKFRDALIDPTVITPLETAIEGITTPRDLLTPNEFLAETFIRLNPDFQTALNDAQTNWLNQILVSVAGDHGVPAGSGPTYTAEREILDPMIRRICSHARANGWAACPPLCP